MTDRVLFVDLENVQRFDLSLVPNDARVFIFYGVTQRTLPEELVVRAQPLGPRLKWIRIAGQGPNALDFHIAFYLGQEFASNPASKCTILSRDTGFDPLTRHIESLRGICRRVTSLKDAFPGDHPVVVLTERLTEAIRQIPDEADHFTRLVALLRKEKVRPARRKGLSGKVKSWFPDLTEDGRLALIQRLFDESGVHESEKVLTYNL